MRGLLQAWQEAQPNLPKPRGRWAVERRDGGGAVGGLSIRLLPPPYEDDLEVSWQLASGAWGHRYATEAAPALLESPVTQDVDELLAVAPPVNRPGIPAA